MASFSNNYFESASGATPVNQTIITQGLGEAFDKWLRFNKLKKHQWFFNALNYREITLIDENNIKGFISMVNRNSMNKQSISEEDQIKICMETKKFRQRPMKLKRLVTLVCLIIA